MTRRETYPCASLESVTSLVTAVSNAGLITRRNLQEAGISPDDLRLTEMLGLVEAKGNTNTYFNLTELGNYFYVLTEEKRRMVLFYCLVRQNEVMPDYFSKLIENKELYDHRISTHEVCKKLNMKDLWSADILSEWCQFLGISEGKSKSEILLSSQKVAKIKSGAFELVLKQEYKRLSGPSGLVPVSKLRRELKNSGILCLNDDFDDMLELLSNNKKKGEDIISFHPAPSKFVGQGLKNKQGYELISISSGGKSN